jgi:hypothetical protein
MLSPGVRGMGRQSLSQNSTQQVFIEHLLHASSMPGSRNSVENETGSWGHLVWSTAGQENYEMSHVYNLKSDEKQTGILILVSSHVTNMSEMFSCQHMNKFPAFFSNSPFELGVCFALTAHPLD